MANVFGSRLMSLRKNRELTRDQLAAELNMSVNTLRNYELGLRKAPIAFTAQVAKYFAVSTDYLLGVDDNPEGSEKALYRILAKVMEAKGLDCLKVAEICGIPPTTINFMLSMQAKSTTMEYALKLSEGLGISVRQLAGLDDIDYATLSAGINQSADKQIGEYSAAQLLQAALQKSGVLASGQQLTEQQAQKCLNVLKAVLD